MVARPCVMLWWQVRHKGDPQCIQGMHNLLGMSSCTEIATEVLVLG